MDNEELENEDTELESGVENFDEIENEKFIWLEEGRMMRLLSWIR